MNTQKNIKSLGIKNKVEAIGRVLIVSSELDSKRREYKKLQNILGEKLYYSKSGKWFYNIPAIKNKTITELNILADKIEESVKSIN